jgi:hypothetical protein
VSVTFDTKKVRRQIIYRLSDFCKVLREFVRRVVDIRLSCHLPAHLNITYSDAPAARNEPDPVVSDNSNMLITVDELSLSRRKADVLNPRFIVIFGPTK